MPELKYILSILLMNWFVIVDAQIVINEVSAAQNSGYPDEDADYPDWIELYNLGTLPVNLEGFTLERMEDDLMRWKFPSIEIGPSDHLVVFASGKDRRSYINHWEVPAYPQLNWTYYAGAASDLKFPSIEIGPSDHLVVFASGKDRRSYINHWEVPAYPQLNWTYYAGAA